MLEKGRDDTVRSSKNPKKMPLDAQDMLLPINNIVFEQWKTAIESASDISSNRIAMNGIFITGLSILIGGIIFCNSLQSIYTNQRIILTISVSAMGIILCKLWIEYLEYYHSLNNIKYERIRSIEKALPEQIFIYEYNEFYTKMQSFSKKEKHIPMLFIVVFLVIMVVFCTPVVKQIMTKT